MLSGSAKRYFLIVTDKQRAGLQQQMATLTGNPRDVDTFIKPLSATGKLPATHWGADMILPEKWQHTVENMPPARMQTYSVGADDASFEEFAATGGLKVIGVEL